MKNSLSGFFFVWVALVTPFICGNKGRIEVHNSGYTPTNSETYKKPRLLVLTDIGGDPDDQQSLIRLLVYANEFDMEGIVVEGWKKYSGYDQIGLAKSILESYGQVRDNLLLHKKGYPTEEDLKNVVKRGAVDVVKQVGPWEEYIGKGKDTEGSRHIVSVLEKKDPRPIDVVAWGGTADLAQALWWLRENRSSAAMDAIISKIRLHAIAHQDSTGPWILENFPDLFFILNLAPGESSLTSVFRGMYLGGNEQLTSLNWINSHVREDHGPLGALYPAKTHTQHNPHGALKEGDTPSWFYFYRNGLNNPAKPSYGGWGGRFDPKLTYFNDAEDKVGDERSARATVWRWRPAFQNDFQARMDWCVKSFEEANHNPVAILYGDTSKNIIEIKASPGSKVVLNAEGSTDLDGDELFFRWFIYEGVGTYRNPVKIINSHAQESTVIIPKGAVIDQDMHVILEVKDDGSPVLYSYRRAVITVIKDETQ